MTPIISSKDVRNNCKQNWHSTSLYFSERCDTEVIYMNNDFSLLYLTFDVIVCCSYSIASGAVVFASTFFLNIHKIKQKEKISSHRKIKIFSSITTFSIRRYVKGIPLSFYPWYHFTKVCVYIHFKHDMSKTFCHIPFS